MKQFSFLLIVGSLVLANVGCSTKKCAPAGETPTETAPADTEAPPPAEPAAPAEPPPPANYAKTLSTGYELQGNPDGIESQLIAFIEDSSRPVDKTTWFNFDRLNFETGGTDLDLATSQAQLTNMSEILKAYPNVELRIGGYTDNVGSPKANKTLSQKRADAVRNQLIGAGTAKKRLTAEGYGQEHPVCPANDTDECKAQNRRIAVRVTKK